MEIFRKINNLSLRYQDYTAQNLSKMVQIKSLSMGEKEVQLELKRQMLEAGFDEVRIDGLGNVIGRIARPWCRAAKRCAVDRTARGIASVGRRPQGA